MDFPERMHKFIKEHHVLSLSTFGKKGLWSSSCFYVFNKAELSFIIISDSDTLHAQQVLENKEVSGTIALETKVIGKIRGIQFLGEMLKVEDEEKKKAKNIYLRKFPYAILTSTSLWIIKLKHVKMTDNRLGFGKKLFWP